MKNKKENKKLISLRLHPSDIKKLDKLAKKNKTTRTKVIQNSIEFYTENLGILNTQ